MDLANQFLFAKGAVFVNVTLKNAGGIFRESIYSSPDKEAVLIAFIEQLQSQNLLKLHHEEKSDEFIWNYHFKNIAVYNSFQNFLTSNNVIHRKVKISRQFVSRGEDLYVNSVISFG